MWGTAIGNRARAIAVGAMTLLVCACLFAPGRFSSTLDVRKDRSFSFTYSGEIYLLPLVDAAKKSVFSAQPCTDEDSGGERACSKEELAAQKSEWEAGQAQEKAQAASMKGMFGGIDPSDPNAPQEIAAKMRRQTGWKRVDYKGDGKFDVDYAISARLDHDFSFPTLEGFPLTNPFVQIVLRNDGSVRVDAPGYGPPGSATGAGGLAQAAMMSGASGEDGSPSGPPEIDGTFALTTDAKILANNTDEGPKPHASGQSMSWKVTSRSAAAPTALLQLGN